MRLKDYDRNPKKRKEYVQQSGLLLVGVDVSKAKHDACDTFKKPATINEAPVQERALTKEANGIRASTAIVGVQ